MEQDEENKKGPADRGEGKCLAGSRDKAGSQPSGGTWQSPAVTVDPQTPKFSCSGKGGCFGGWIL